MMGLLGSIHSLGGKDADRYFFTEEVIDDSPGDFVVKLLLFLRVELTLFRVSSYKLFKSLFVDVVVHFAPLHALEEVEPFDGPALVVHGLGKESFYYLA